MPPDRAERTELLIVGSGPAGLSAAIEARRLGIGRVTVLERDGQPGGIPRHCGHSPWGLREFGRPMTGPAYARRLAARAREVGVAIERGASVVAIAAGPSATVTTDAGVREIAAQRLLLATGARESSRAARLLGGTKPGCVMNTGALQALVYLKGERPFHRPVVLGSELVAFSALLTCRHAGIRPAAMIEEGPRAVARWPAALLPRVLGVPFHRNTTVEAVEGVSRVTDVVVRGPDGAARRIAADGLILCGRFRPESSLVRTSHLELDEATLGPSVDQFGRTSDPHVFAAGNLLRPVETGAWCWREGRDAARAIARSLAGTLPPPEPALRLLCADEAIKLAVPQRVLPDRRRTGHIELRAATTIKGHVALTVAGADLATVAVDSRPERRILLPMRIVPPNATGTCELRLGRKGS